MRQKEGRKERPHAGRLEKEGPPAGWLEKEGPPAGRLEKEGPPAGRLEKEGPSAGRLEKEGPPAGRSKEGERCTGVPRESLLVLNNLLASVLRTELGKGHMFSMYFTDATWISAFVTLY